VGHEWSGAAPSQCHWRLWQQPRQRDLAGRDLLTLGDLDDQVDDRLVRGEGFGGEA
jgi:hypothetical protein